MGSVSGVYAVKISCLRLNKISNIEALFSIRSTLLESIDTEFIMKTVIALPLNN
jgi:hypothetical protein